MQRTNWQRKEPSKEVFRIGRILRGNEDLSLGLVKKL